MSAEITFILEPDSGRITVESSQASADVAREIKSSLGHFTNLNCGRPESSEKSVEREVLEKPLAEVESLDGSNALYLFRLYHRSTVDGPGRRSVIQMAGCSILCAGCYLPETHRRVSGQLTLIDKIIAEIDERRSEHDGVTILGGEPFDQAESLEELVFGLKKKNYHLTVYTGYLIEDLIEKGSRTIERILSGTDLLIDGPFKSELSKNAGEYRGSSNQRVISEPLSTCPG